MVQVDKEAFYDFINPRDIICSVKHISSDKTICEFKTRDGALVGKTIDDRTKFPTQSEFYLKQKTSKGE